MMAPISGQAPHLKKKKTYPKIPKNRNLISRNQNPLCSSHLQAELPSKILNKAEKQNLDPHRSHEIPAATSTAEPGWIPIHLNGSQAAPF